MFFSNNANTGSCNIKIYTCYDHVNRLIEFQPMYGQKEESMIWGIWGCVTPDVEL